MTLNASPPADHPADRTWTAGALLLLAAVTVGPLLAESRPVDFLPPYPSGLQTAAAAAAVLGCMALALGVRAWLDGRREPGAVGNTLLFAALAAAMTACHWAIVDSDPVRLHGQRRLYVELFNHTCGAPHQYRPLPYGVARLLERITHDWTFACLAYRWFFTFWFVRAAYRFARLYHGPPRALLTLVPLALLYPLSILYYWGQLTDPLSHALFVLALVYVLEDRPLALAGALALGVLAKETAVLVVPVYLACHRRRGWAALGTTAGLGVAGVAAFVAVRSPGWRPGSEALNGAGWMVGTNLGVGTPIAWTTVPLYQNYLHPLLFVGAFVPALARHWGRIDPRLRALFLTLAPLLLASNLCFGWLYESRNYMPLVPVLATMALPVSAATAGATGGEARPGPCH
jgi:hypothetical protein